MELVLIVPRTHALARRRQVRLREVADEPFVLFKEGHAIRRMTDDLCRAAGFTPTRASRATIPAACPASWRLASGSPSCRPRAPAPPRW